MYCNEMKKCARHQFMLLYLSQQKKTNMRMRHGNAYSTNILGSYGSWGLVSSNES